MAIDLIYPLSLVILGAVAATNMASLPYAAGLVVLMLAFNSFNKSSLSTMQIGVNCLGQPKLRKVLIPDQYQNFELAEKTVISHNTASYYSPFA
jgi:hypothetical protein